MFTLRDLILTVADRLTPADADALLDILDRAGVLDDAPPPPTPGSAGRRLSLVAARS